ncbi:uncharacterized protein BXZ73DRAFT_80535 [Epithele typhae]|uniref:uncharacterized protein n=1 Tax=Epithele typhae TaxID=378194 RepID=UPI002007A416|nr:uncharacterized protein BXZ73DRAFT_80535 [Epithele typhae]KAH9918766.1 hypothetical protein BXZ73DRAFT_80535 [Epithele typhae]
MEASARPSLSVRCPTALPEKAAITELAMTIAEEVASLSRSPLPIGIDMPLKHSGLNPKTLSQFHAWLMSEHGYDASYTRLLEADTTPRSSPPTFLPHPAHSSGQGGRFRLVRESPRPPCPARSMSVDVTTEPEEVPVLPSAAVRQGAADLGMASYDSWAGKKTSLMYGLLALGIVGSPLSPPARAPTALAALKSPAVPASFQTGTRMRPVAPLEDPRAALPTRTPIFVSFMDSVRMPGVDLVQSPWIPDRNYASLDGVLEELTFPSTPHSY